MKGCEEEGLYRVPGAAQQVKFYEQKFDQGAYKIIWLVYNSANGDQTETSI